MPINELIRHFSVHSTFVCARCGSSEGYNRERQGLLEQYILPLLRLQPMRCCDCGERSHWLPSRLVANPANGAVPAVQATRLG